MLPEPACRAVARRGSSLHGHDWLRPTRRGDNCPQAQSLGARHPQGRPIAEGRPLVASPATSRGDGASRRGGRPLVGRLPVGKGHHHQRRGDSSGSAMRVKDG
ncbi:hypothetical protein BHM03_00058702 [Ensete ventricosum]|nr:hypothetical protein BHM03_00058702 [Ensete ventricosum]